MTARLILLVGLALVALLPGESRSASGAASSGCSAMVRLLQVRLSPDGGALLYSALCNNNVIFSNVRDLQTQRDTYLGNVVAGDWSPDGSRFVQADCTPHPCTRMILTIGGGGHHARLSLRGRGGGEATPIPLTFPADYGTVWGWGNRIAYETCHAATRHSGVYPGYREVFTTREDGSHNQRLRTRRPPASGWRCDVPVEWSRDGKRLAVSSAVASEAIRLGSDVIDLEGKVTSLPRKAIHLGFLGTGKTALVLIRASRQQLKGRVAVMRVADGRIMSWLPGRHQSGLVTREGGVALLADGRVKVGLPGDPLSSLGGLPVLSGLWRSSGPHIVGRIKHTNQPIVFTTSGTIVSDAPVTLPPPS